MRPPGMEMAIAEFFRLTGAFLVGVIALVAALIIFAMFLSTTLAFFATVFPFLSGSALIIAAVVTLWILIYFTIMIGIGIYYAVKHPAKVSAAHSAYVTTRARGAAAGGRGAALQAPKRHPAPKSAAKAKKPARKKRAPKKKRAARKKR